MTPPALRTEGLSKSFGALQALDDLSLEVAPGEVFGYLGPNGAGKTTTIRLLLDFIRPSRGRAEILGARPGDPASRRRVGYLPADLRLDPRYTGAEVVDLYGRLRGGVDRAWVDQLYQRFELDPHRVIGELSTGNRRKVGIVQAFMHRPDLLILDEPTSGLDPLLQQEFHQVIHEATAWGATVFLSSHVLHEVEQLAGRVGILRRGRLIRVAGVEDLRESARQRIDLHLAQPVPADAFTGVPGVVEATVDATGTLVHLLVEGSADALVKRAATFDVVRIVAPEGDLEDVFLGFYEDRQ